jgi:UDP-N-acetylmuramate--alanine ligase
LSPIATVLLELGIQVSGSDRQARAPSRRGWRNWARRCMSAMRQPASPTCLPGSAPTVVLISSAVDAANPERVAAVELGIPVVKRAEFLPALLAGRRLIAVAGTHGKTTTTAMTVQALRAGGIDCGYIIGAEVPVYGSAAAGSSARVCDRSRRV